MSVENEKRGLSTLRVNTNPNWSSSHRQERSCTSLSASSSISSNSRNTSGTTPPTNQSHQTNQPLSKTARGGCLCILVGIFFERIAFYGLVGNLVLFLNKPPFLWVSYHAQGTLLLFFGVAFLMAPVGGWIADSYLGRFKTIVVAFLLYMAGYSLLPFVSKNEQDLKDWTDSSATHRPKGLPEICGSSNNGTSLTPHTSPFGESCAWLIYLILVAIAMADGCAKSNLGPFGSDQLSGASSSTHLSFFNWYYWCSNMGAFVGLGAMSYIEQQYSFYWGYIICAMCLAVGIVIFIAGRFFYTTLPPNGSVISVIINVIREAWTRKKQRNNSLKNRENSARSGLAVLSDDFESIDSISNNGGKVRFLDHATRQHGGTFDNCVVNDVRRLKIILAVFAALIPYWLTYYQMQTTFFFQGLHMKLTFSDMTDDHNVTNYNSSSPIPAVWTNGTNTDNVPEIASAWFTLFDILFVILLLPLFDRVVYPRLSRAGYPFTFAKRVVVGMVFSIAAMVVAGVVEHYRLKAFWPYPDHPCVNASLPQYISNSKYDAANMSVLWQIPQYAFMGISEVFVSVSSLQFAVSVAPKSMKAMITGIYYTSSGLGSLLGTLLLTIFSQAKVWLINKDFGNISCRLPCTEKHSYVTKSCHLDYYFYFLGGLETVSLIIFIYVSYKFGLNREHPLTHNTNTPTKGTSQYRSIGSESSS